MPSANMLDSAYLQFKLDYAGTAGGGTVKSRHVSAGGHVWRVRCYPHGDGMNKGEHLSLFFDLLGNESGSDADAAIKAVFDAFVMDKDGAPSSSPPHAMRRVVVYPPTGGFRSWGWGQFASLADLELLGGGSAGAVITLVCGIVVFGEPPGRPSSASSDLRSHLGRLLESGEEEGTTSDVSLSVGGETFRAHRAVLAARSPVFKAELFGLMAESRMPCITLHDIEPETFRAMLRYMYTDTLPAAAADDDDELSRNLLVAADRYDVAGLKLLCTDRLVEGVSVETVAETLHFADMHGCPELKKRCLAFVTEEENLEKVAATEGYARLAELCPWVIGEIGERQKRRELREERRRRAVLAVERGWSCKRMKFASKRRVAQTDEATSFALRF